MIIAQVGVITMLGAAGYGMHTKRLHDRATQITKPREPIMQPIISMKVMKVLLLGGTGGERAVLG